jgi:hypothetical protein
MAAATAISDAELRAADAIHTIDPYDRNAAGHQLWGHRSQESQVQERCAASSGTCEQTGPADRSLSVTMFAPPRIAMASLPMALPIDRG